MLSVHSCPDLMAIVLEFDLNQPWWLRLARAQTIIPKQVLPMKDAEELSVSATDLNHDRTLNLLTKIWHGWQFAGLELVWRAQNCGKVERALSQGRAPPVSNEASIVHCSILLLFPNIWTNGVCTWRRIQNSFKHKENNRRWIREDRQTRLEECQLPLPPICSWGWADSKVHKRRWKTQNRGKNRWWCNNREDTITIKRRGKGTEVAGRARHWLQKGKRLSFYWNHRDLSKGAKVIAATQGKKKEKSRCCL